MRHLFVLVGIVALMFGSTALAKEKKADKVKPAKVTGVISKIEDVKDQTGVKTITITYKSKADATEQTLVLTAGDATKVVLETGEKETFTNKNGQEKQRPKTKDGTLADLQTDQHVQVTFTPDNKASEILVKIVKAKKQGAATKKNKGGA